MNSNYTGDAIVVRRDSDNATANIGFVGGELNTTYLNEFCNGANGFVTTWFDQSGNGFDATNTTAANQPKIYDSVNGVELENGKPAIRWRLFAVQGLQAIFNQTYSQPNTFFIVTDKEDTTGYLFDGSGAINRNAQFDFDMFAGGGYLYDVLDTNDLNNQILFTGLFNTANSDAYVNSINTASGSVAASSLDGVTIGNRYTFNSSGTTTTYKGTIQELIIYNTNQSSNRTGIETNINNFYSIY